MRITISFKFLLLFLFILFKNVISHEIKNFKKFNNNETDIVVVAATTSATTLSSKFIKNNNYNINNDFLNKRTTEHNNKSIKIINNSEAVNIIYNNNKNDNNLSKINNLHNLNIRYNLTNYDIPKPLNLNNNNNNNSNDDYNNNDDEVDEKNQSYENQQSKNLDIEHLSDDNLFSFRHFDTHHHSNHHKSKSKSKRPSFLNVALQTAARQGLEAMTNLYERTEPEILRRRQILPENHPAFKLAKFNAPHDEIIGESAKGAFATLEATKLFQKSYKRTTTELGRQATSTKFSFRRTALEGLCPPREFPVCLPAAKRYRTHDGTCNNLKHPRWGSAQMPFNRFLPPEYGDGIDTVRVSIEGGGALSSARFVSLLVHGAREGNAPVTLILAQWGQLIDHDLTSTAQPRSINGSIPRCCGPNDFHPSCFPIKVPLDDPWLAPLKVRCLEFLRSAPAQRRDCVMSWREQTNQVTSFLDASPIYSSNARTSDSARVFRHGLLQFGKGNPNDDVCKKGAFSPNCIKSGDPRSNEQPGLLALHHVWVSEHNRIASEISFLNPHWSDEKVYQETRRIVGALFQHITFREFLPIVLGREVCRLFDLELLNSGFYTGYDPHVNPTVANSFSAAAFRFGHSLIPNSYIRCDQGHNMIQNNVSLHEEFAHGDLGTRGSLHRLLRGMVNQRALQRDEFITPELTNHLFQTGSFPFGLDLAAINIQRGRDHGIPPYTAWREPCGLSPINDWNDLNQVVGPESVRRMRHAYVSVHDIDLFVGGIAERAVVGGLVGPTFACIIAQQFSNLRRGDRFWYENGGFENSFSAAQLHSIRRISLAQVLCRATGGGTFQPHIFIPHEADNNERLPCGIGVLAPIDLRPWKEQDPFKNTGTDIPPSLITPLTNDVPQPILNNKEMQTEDTLTLTDDIVPTIETSAIKDSNGKDPKANVLLNRIDFVPNGSTGFHRPLPEHTQSQINDKLDFSNKKTTKRTHVINVQVVNNKLDSKNRNHRNTTALPTKRVTTKRKVFVNNVQIELGRTANGGQENKNLKKQVPEQTNTNNTKDKDNLTKSGKMVVDKLRNNDKTESTKELSNEKHVQENGNNRTNLEQTKDNYKNIELTESSNIKQDDIFVLHDENEMMQTDETKNRALSTSEINKNPILCKTTKENETQPHLTNKQDTIKTIQTECIYDNTKIQNKNAEHKSDSPIKTGELRNFVNDNSGPDNKLRKQNINIITPNNEQNQEYEIEINIRKTNKNRKPITALTTDNHKSTILPIRNDFNLLTQQPQPIDDSPFSHIPSRQTLPISQYNNIHTRIPSFQTTKPPKVYYLTDEDENTTPRPGFFDNILPSITGTFSGLFNSIQSLNPSYPSTTTEQPNIFEPNRHVGKPQHSPMTGTLINGIAQDTNSPGQTLFFQPVLPDNANFDHNINNKKPDLININIRPSVQQSNNNKPGYGLVSKPIEINQNDWNNYLSSAVTYKPTQYSYSDKNHVTTRIPYYDRPSTNYGPQIQETYPQSQVYIQNFDQRKPYYRHGNIDDQPIEHKNIDLQINPMKSKLVTRSTNIEDVTIFNTETKTDINEENENYKNSKEDNNDETDYYDDTETESVTNEQKINEQFDKDGYLRPEHTFLNLQNEDLNLDNETLIKQTLVSPTTITTTLNDNFVMPVLLTKTNTKTDIEPSRLRTKPIQLTELLPRSPLTEIKADIVDQIVEQLKNEFDDKSEDKTSSSSNGLIFDNESLPLPNLPEFKIDNGESTNEFPKPINTIKWRKHFTLQNN